MNNMAERIAIFMFCVYLPMYLNAQSPDDESSTNHFLDRNTMIVVTLALLIPIVVLMVALTLLYYCYIKKRWGRHVDTDSDHGYLLTTFPDHPPDPAAVDRRLVHQASLDSIPAAVHLPKYDDLKFEHPPSYEDATQTDCV